MKSFFVFFFFLSVKLSAQVVHDFQLKDTLSSKSPVPLSYITPKSIKILADLENKQRHIQSYDDLNFFKGQWQGLGSEIQGYLDDFKSVNFYEHKTRILYDHQQELKYWKRRIEEFQEQISDKGNDLENQYNDLYKLGEKWIITLENAVRLNAESVVVDQIETVINEINATQKQIRKTQTHFITIDGDIAKKELILEEKISALKVYRASLLTSWKTNPRYFSVIDYSLPKYLSFKKQEFVRDFEHLVWVVYTIKWVHIFKLFIVFMLCWMVIYLAQRNIKNFPFWSQEMKSEGSIQFVFRHKVLLSLLCTLLLSFEIIPYLSYFQLMVLNCIVILIISKIYGGLNFIRFKGSWWVLVLLMLITYLLLPFDIVFVYDIINVLIFNALMIYLTIKYVWKSNVDYSWIKQIRYSLILLPLISLIGLILKNKSLVFVPIDFALSAVMFALIFAVIQRVVLLVLPIGIIGPHLYFLNTVNKNKDAIAYRVQAWIKFLSGFLWVFIPLIMVQQTENVLDFILSILNYAIEVGTLSFSLSTVFIFALGVYFTRFISRIILTFLREDVFPNTGIKEDGASAIILLTRYFMFAFGFLISLAAAGIDLSNLAVVLGALSVGIGFGLQGLVSNFISGLILLAERPFKLGDILELTDNTFGSIKEIGIRSSKIQMLNGSEVIVPNDELVSSQLTNWTLSDQNRRIKIIIGVSYDADPRFVKKLLHEVVAKNEKVLSHPPSIIALDEFGDSSINFKALVWFGENWIEDKGDLMADIFMAFKENNVVIPFPQRDIHIIDEGTMQEQKLKESTS